MGGAARAARRFAARHVALISAAAPRGVATLRPAQRVGPLRRAWDASAQPTILRRPDVDPNRLVLQGDSHGGWTTLLAIERGRFNLPEHFAAAIAFYPYCYPARGFTAPLLVLIGDHDDWTPAERCTDMVAKPGERRGGNELQLRVFLGATHAYDFPFPARTNRLAHYWRPTRPTRGWSAIDARF